MADYWKSQPRKFCQYCKCWIADNKPSVEFHERGKNHKENVAAKIAEIKKKSVDKAKQEERMSKDFKAMEEAALKAYQEDLKRMELEAGGYSVPAPKTTTSSSAAKPQPLVQPQRPVQPQIKKQQKKKPKPARSFRPKQETPLWVEGKTDDGHTYYYNTVTGDSQWVKPEGFQGGSSDSAPPGQNESSSGSTWMEGVSPEGYTYYYNTQTGESSWEKPADFASNEASGAGPGSSKEEEAEEEEEESPEEPSTSKPEQLSGEEQSSYVAQTSQEAEVTEQASQQPRVLKISFRKRKAEPEPVEKEGGEDEASGDSPQEPAEQTKKEDEVQSSTAQPEEKKEIVVTHAKRPKAANPYGAWEQIQEEEDPYAKVDLQLPQVEEDAAAAAPDAPPEPKQKFKERIITSLGVEGGSTSFKKNKTQNGKSRSLRQRDSDD